MRNRTLWREFFAVDRWTAHRPTFYRYRVAEPARFQPLWNKCSNHTPIGAAVVVGRYAYCVKWARSGGTQQAGRQ